MRHLFLLLSLFVPPLSGFAAPPKIEAVAGPSCKDGVHKQPRGPFGVYVFCDDALGTNIAVFYPQLGDPRYEKWTLTRRFWQDAPWSADVHSLGWVPNRNLLVVTTSEIYGAGSVFLLDLEKQTSEVLASTEDCGSSIVALSESSVTVGLNNCEDAKPFKKVEVKFPQSNPAVHPDSAPAALRR